MTPSQFLLIVRVRWLSAALVFASVVAAIAAFTLVVPKSFTASGAVVLDVKSPDPISGVVLPGMTVSGYMATQVDVLQSERVMFRALHALHAERDPELRAEWQASTDGKGDLEPWLAERVLKHLEAKPGKESNVIVVTYSAADPKVSADTVNAVIAAYIETTLELRTDPAKQFNASFDLSTKTLRDALEAAQAKFSNFQQTKGLFAADEKLDIENARLLELSTQMVQLQAVTNESGSRQVQASAKGDQMQEVLGNEMIMNLGADLARAEARLRELGERYGERHPQVIELQANIKELRSRLNAERARIVGSLSVNNASNQARLESLRVALDAQRSKVLRLKGLREEATVLQRDVDNAQRSYDASFAKRSQSTLESQATQTNVSVIKTASPPARPSSPRLKLNLAVGLVLGAVLGLATAVFREHRDWRLRTDADVLDALKQPLLGVLPDRRRSQRGDWRSHAALATRVLGMRRLSRSQS